MNHAEHLRNEGYVLISNVYTAEETRLLRAHAEQAFAVPSNNPSDGDENYVRHHLGVEFRGSNRSLVLIRKPEFHPFIFRKGFVDALTEVLGRDFVLFPDGGLQKSNYGGWHKDTGYQESQGHYWHYRRGYQVVTFVIYLQDNDEYGGGLDVRPGSHKQPNSRGFLQRVQRRLGFKPPQYAEASIPNKAGNVLVFDQRLFHRATPPKIVPVPPGKEKIGLFMSASRNNEFARPYMDVLRARPELKFLASYSSPPELVDLARRSGITLL